MTEDEMYRRIYDGNISLKEFKRWFNEKISKAYNKGVEESLEEFTYEEVSRSQYD